MLKKKKTFIFILIMIICIFAFNNVALATVIDTTKYDPGKDDPLDPTSRTIIGKILGIITTVGSVAAILFLVIIGIRFMLGSVEEKAQYKESLKPYLIGAFLLFAILQIVDKLYNLGTGLIT